MRLSRLFVSGDLRPDLQLDLNEDQTHYIGRVLRLRAGDSLAVFNGDKGEFSATVASIAKTSAVIKLHDRSETTTESPLKVHLVQGVSRGERMDFVVQKATELGVKRISPVLTEHGVVKLDASRATRRRDHWQKIAESACEQSGRIRPPLIDTPMPLKSWLETRTEAADTDLILQPGAATPLTSVQKPQNKVCILIGPEGGFSDKEIADAAIAGFVSVSLGPRILRTESAAIASIAIVQSLWGDLAL